MVDGIHAAPPANKLDENPKDKAGIQKDPDSECATQPQGSWQ
jgi:hypothetical protein